MIAERRPFIRQTPRFRPRRWSALASCLYALVGASAIGLLTAASPKYAALIIVVVAVAIAAWRQPRSLAIIAALTFIWDPEDILHGAFSNYPQAQKLLILFAGLLMMQRRGIRFSFALPILGYVGLAALSAIGGTPAPGLTLYQTLLSFLTLTVAWVMFSVRWRRKDVFVLLRVFAWMPLVSLALGVALYAVHKWVPIDDLVSPERLQGALIAPFLAMTATVGALSCVILGRVFAWRWSRYLVPINAMIVFATVTRGAMICCTLALLPAAVRLARRWVRPVSLRELARIVLVVIVAAAAVGYVVSTVAARDDQTIFVPGQGEVKDDISSGRTAAWAFSYNIAKVNLLFGRGLGAAPVIGAQYKSFLAQHNEYLRMLLEGGYVGGILVLFCIAISVARALALTPRIIRVDLIFFAVGFAIYSFTDNTLSNPQFALPMALLFAFGASLGSQGSAGAMTLPMSPRVRVDPGPTYPEPVWVSVARTLETEAESPADGDDVSRWHDPENMTTS